MSGGGMMGRGAGVVGIVALSFLQPCVAQNRVPGGAIYPEKLIDDLEMWRTTLHEAHPDPYRYVSKAELDRTFDQVKREVKVPMTAMEFIDVIMPVVRALGDAHSHVELPEDLSAYIRSDAPLLPLAVRVIGGELYVEEELKGFRTIPPGSRILELNGTSGKKVIDTITRLIATDGADSVFQYRSLEVRFPEWFHRAFGDTGPFDVRYMTITGEVATSRIFPLTGDEIRASYRSPEETMSAWSYANLPDHNTVWWTIRTFDPNVLDGEGIKADRFADMLRKDMRNFETRTLVIDVRGAGGSELATAESVMSVIAQQPYQVIQDMTVRSVVKPTHYAACDNVDGFYETVNANYLPGTHDKYVLRPDDPLMESVEPLAKSFNGKVYVVCNGLTREAGASLVMMAKRSGRARVVGEEVGTNCASSCGGRELRLKGPNSGVIFHIPLIRYVHSGAPTGPLDHGEMPNHNVERTTYSLAGGRDHVKQALLEMILELQ